MGGPVEQPADSRTASVGPEEAIELHLALEGERRGLPVFCCETALFRVDGRAVPARLVVSPEDAGLRDVVIRWIELTPTTDERSWERSDLRLQQGDWSLPVLDLPGTPDPGMSPSVGTARYAVSVSFLDAGNRRIQFATDGAFVRPGWEDPQLAPGFRVIRHGGDTLPGRAAALARLPVRPDVDAAFVHARIAVRPVDPFLIAYGDLAESPWPDSVSVDLTAPSWHWLLEEVAHGRRRADAHAPVVGTDGHGIPWSRTDDSTGVAEGDVIFAGGYAGYLQADDGDYWLGNGDRVLSGATGRVAFGTLADFPAGEVVVLRPRDFRRVIRALDRAGYGPLPDAMVWTGRARRAIASFQTDQGLPATGNPDETTRARLDEVLVNMRAADEAAPTDPAR